jgi:hypothetical protein
MKNTQRQFNKTTFNAILQNSYLDAITNYNVIVGIQNDGERTKSILETSELCLYYNKHTKKYCLDIETLYKFSNAEYMYQHYYLLTLLMLYYLKDDGYDFSFIKRNLSDSEVVKDIKQKYKHKLFADSIGDCMEHTNLNCLLVEYLCKFNINGLIEELD